MRILKFLIKNTVYLHSFSKNYLAIKAVFQIFSCMKNKLKIKFKLGVCGKWVKQRPFWLLKISVSHNNKCMIECLINCNCLGLNKTFFSDYPVFLNANT